MRRIGWALPLVGVIAAAGCGGSSKPTSTTEAKGTAVITFNLKVNNQGPGTISDSSTPPNTCAPDTTCDWAYPAESTVTLTATNIGDSSFVGWFGDCQGTGACVLAGRADKYVVAYFSAEPKTPPGHP